MDRQTIAEFAAGNRVDVAAVQRVEDELAKLAEAGVEQPEGYSISPPLGRPADMVQRQMLANARPDDDPAWREQPGTSFIGVRGHR